MDLVGKSHWWGFPDLPEAFEWSCSSDSETLITFICQIRLEEIAELDTEGRLPHKGMLWFFADMDYFLVTLMHHAQDQENGKQTHSRFSTAKTVQTFSHMNIIGRMENRQFLQQKR